MLTEFACWIPLIVLAFEKCHSTLVFAPEKRRCLVTNPDSAQKMLSVMHVQQRRFMHANVVLDAAVSMHKLIPKGAPIAKGAMDITCCIQKRVPTCAPLPKVAMEM